MSRLRALTARLALVAGGLLIGVLLAEGLARLIAPDAAADLLFDAPSNAPDGMYVADRQLGWAPNPGFSGTLRSLGYSVPIQFNSLGHRGGEPAQPGGWLVVGDSFTLAAQVPEEETFTDRLRQAGIPAENAGVDGYSTWHARIRYARAADKLQPDGVLLIYFLGNDPGDDERFASGIHMLPGATHGQPLDSPAGGGPTAFLAQRSFVYGQLRVWMRRRALASSGGTDWNTDKWRAELRAFTKPGQQQLQQVLSRGSQRALAQLRDDVKRRGDKLVVALAPPAFVVEEARREATFTLVGLDPATADVDGPARAVSAELARLGVSTCDLTPALRQAAGSGEALYFTYDGHWTAAGHRVVADALVDCLK